MTESEAISAIQNDLKWHSKELKPAYKEALNMAIKALEKQIAKKPIQKSASIIDCIGIKKEFVKDVCPCCGRDLDIREQFREYPCKCGQKLDWE